MKQRLVSPRAARTRSALLDAGLDLLARRPIDAIAVDEFVAAAGVAKGSFFNHFADKRAFASAIADDIRAEIEARVEAVNTGVEDPIDRLLGGMAAAAAYAVEEPRRSAVLARAAQGMTAMDYPLNRGVIADIRSSLNAGLLRPEAGRVGVLFWLSCCQALMATLVERQPDAAAATAVLRDMALLALCGLGVDGARAAAAAMRLDLSATAKSPPRNVEEVS